MARIVITGGAGFIGSNFVIDWLAHSDEPVLNLDALTYAGNLDNLKSLSGDPRHHFVRGDIGDAGLLADLFKTHRPRAIIHFAAESHVDRSITNPLEFVMTNVIGTVNLLNAAKTVWADAMDQHRFYHVSTDEVYGSLGDTGLFTEETKYDPHSPYSASKASSDHFVRAYHDTYKLPVVLSNCSNNYGPFQFPEKLIPVVIQSILARRPIPVYGDGLNVRDWLYVEDHCRAIARVLEAGRVGETYNIGGWNEKANLEVVNAICKILDELRPRADKKSYIEQITFVKDRPGHDRR